MTGMLEPVFQKRCDIRPFLHANVAGLLLALHNVLRVAMEPRDYVFLPSSAYWFFPRRPVETWFYILGLVLVFAYFLYVSLLGSRLAARGREQGPAAAWALGSLLLAAVPALSGRLYLSLAVAAAVWLAPLAALWGGRPGFALAADQDGQRARRLAWALLLACCVQAFFMFRALVFDTPRVLNDFFRIPETTLLDAGRLAPYLEQLRARGVDTGDLGAGQPDARGRVAVDNLAFINAGRLYGAHQLHDIRGGAEPCAHCLPVTGDPAALRALVQGLARERQARNVDIYELTVRDKYNPLPVVYERGGRLCVADRIPGDMLPLLYGHVDPAALDALNLRLGSPARAGLPGAVRDFAAANRLELNWQAIARGMAHHHNHVLAPANEWLLGRPAGDIAMQYGWGYTALALAAPKVLGAGGDLEFGAYLRALASLFYVYFLLFLLAAWLLFRNLRFLALAAAALVFSWSRLQYEYVAMAPGFNPLRFFFDAPVLACLALYCRRRSLPALLAAGGLALIGVASCPLTGLFLALALVLAVGYERLSAPERPGPLALAGLGLGLAAFLACALAIYALASTRADATFVYFLNGLANFPVSRHVIALFLAGVFAGFVLDRQCFRQSPLRTAYLFLLFYCAAVFSYFVWGPRSEMFFSIAFKFALLGLLALFLLLGRVADPARRGAWAWGLLLLCAPLLLSGAFTFSRSKAAYDLVFDTHRTYAWKAPRAGFVSTMDPALFEDSVELIRRYSPQERGVFLISQYDRLLPLLASRYSRFASFELMAYLLRPEDIAAAARQVLEERPRHVFVDKDLDSDFNVDIVGVEYIGPYIHSESIWRTYKLENLRAVFHGIRHLYRPVESSLLVTVYERIADAPR